MISMTDFTEIIKLRNSGKTQLEIAEKLGIGRRSVIRYLKEGKIPQYSRSVKSNRKNPLAGFYDLAKEKLKLNNKLPLNELYEYLSEKGYEGSQRTLRRKTLKLRMELKNKEVFFQREVRPGEIIEGDFTELYVSIGNIKRKIYLWVASLPYSNAFFATPYYHCSFEAFADGSVNAFNEFKGVAKKYRLDNFSPAVSKILTGKDRIVTARYAQFQKHYGFEQDFCNPARGNEKGNVEANNKHFKIKILAQISLYQLSFTSLDAFTEFIWKMCREHNQKSSVQSKFIQEELLSLPASAFRCFRTEVVSINKYSLFSLGKTGHMYSVPSKYIGLSLEARIYPTKIEIINDSVIVSTHKRIYGPRGLVSINIEHILDGLLRKPGAVKDWKYREILFERPAWRSFYNKLTEEGGKDKDYLKCLKLISEHGRELITMAMELSIDGGEKLSASLLKKIICNDISNIYEITPLEANLDQYDFFLEGEKDGSQFESMS